MRNFIKKNKYIIKTKRNKMIFKISKFFLKEIH